MNYSHPAEIMDEIARLMPTFTNVSYAKLDEEGSLQWPCNDAAPHGTPTMHIGEFVRGKGRFFVTEYVPTDEKVNARFPLILTTRPHPLAVQRRCADAPYGERGVACRGSPRYPPA